MVFMVFLGIDLTAFYGIAGWTGWVLCLGITLLYYRLWTSAGVDQLRKLKDALAAAQITIARLQEMEMTLKNRNDELHTANAKLHGEYLELRGQFSQLNVAYAKMGEMVATLRDDLNRERTARLEQYGEMLKERAKHGDL